MISTSASFITAANANLNYPIAKVDLLYTDPFINSGNIAASADMNSACGMVTTLKEAMVQQLCDTITATPHKYIVNDGTWINDGTFCWAPGTAQELADNQVGWYSATVADAAGDFAVYPEAIVTFAEDRSIQVVSVVGDPTIGQYPVDYDVYVHDVTGTNELGHETVTGNTSVEDTVDFSADEITTARSIKIVVKKWSVGSTILKMTEFYGVITDTFYMDDIVSLDVLEEMEADNSTSPTGNMSCNELNLELQNVQLIRSNGDIVDDPYFPDNIASYLHNVITQNVRITPYLGFRLPDTFSASNATIIDSDTIAFTANQSVIEGYILNYGTSAIDVVASIINLSGGTVSIANAVYSKYFCTLRFTKLTGSVVTFKIRLTGKAFVQHNLEYVKMGTFWSTEWNVSEDDFAASVTARDRMEILRNNEFVADTIPETCTLYQMAEMVINKAKYSIPMNDLTWTIDSALSGYTLEYPWLGKVNYFEAITKIAEACQGRAYMNREDELIIEAFDADQISGVPDFTVARVDYNKQTRPIKLSTVKNYITVPYGPLAPETESSEIYTTDEITIEAGDTTKTVPIEWGDDAVLEPLAEPVEQEDVSMVVSAGTVYYPWGASVVLTKISGTSGTLKIKITGKKLVAGEVKEKSVWDSLAIAIPNNKKVHKLNHNSMIQTEIAAVAIGNSLLLSLADARRDVTVEYSGNPATEIGDIANIEVYSPTAVYDEFRVMRQQFKFDSTGLQCNFTGRKTVNFGD